MKTLRKIKYTLFILFIIALVSVFYLSSIGLPNSVVRRIEPNLQFSGMVLSLNKIKLSIFEGIVATSVKYHKKGYVGEPVVQADKVVLMLRPVEWFSGRSGISGVIVKNGRVHVDLNGVTNALSDRPARFLAMENIYAHVHFDRQEFLRITNFSTTISGLAISGHGIIILPHENTNTVHASAKGDIAGSLGTNTDISFLKNIPDWLSAINCGKTVSLDVDFFIDPENLDKLTVNANARGRDTSYGNYSIGAWNVNMAANGSKIKAVFSLKDAEIEGVAAQSLNGTAAFDGQHTVTAAVKSVIGRDVHAGPVALQLTYDVSSNRFSGSATTGCDPKIFVPLLKSQHLQLGDIFADFDFKRLPPTSEIFIQGTLTPEFDCRIKGEVLVDTLNYKRVPALLAKVGFDVDLFDVGEKVTIKPLLLVRDEGMVHAQFVYDSDGNIITFSGASMVDPKAVAAMIQPDLAVALEPYSMEGLCYLTAFGTVGCSNSLPNNMEINMQVNDLKWKILRFTPCSLTLRILERTYEIEDFKGTICRGTVTGAASVDPVPDSSNMLLALAGDVDNVDFGMLVNMLAGRHVEEAYEGVCSGSVKLQGFCDDPQEMSLKGKGWIKIANGRIFRVPIFTGLFKILGKFLPGISDLASTNDASATFTIENGRIHTSDARIEGDVFSLKGAGDVYLDGRLDVKVQLTFMRRHSLIGSLIQIATMPITKALEFRLTGTVSDPQWEAAYLPF